MDKYWILMADITGSSELPGDALMERFQQLVDVINHTYADLILSPLSITLGDEFQGIIKDLDAVRALIFAIDEYLLSVQPFFRLRLVANHGTIDTPLNTETAYGMLGTGLTEARKKLNALKKSDEDIHIMGAGNEESTRILSLAFHWYRSVYNDWPEKDRETARDFILHGDYKKVAKLHGRDASSMWRKGQTLKMREFAGARELVTLLIENEYHLA